MTTSREPRPYGGQAHFYDFEYQQYVDDIPFYLERLRAREVTGRVLELGTGTGRVAIPLAEAGFTVLGLDLSEPMLRRARRRRREMPPEVASRLAFAKRDMTRFRFPGTFAAALIPFSTLALVPTAEGRSSCLQLTRDHLEPGGMLYIDLFAPAEIVPGGDEPQRYLQTFPVPPYGHTIEKVVEERYDAHHRVKHITYLFRKKPYVGERILSELTVQFAMAQLSREEVTAALDAAGFDVEEIYGDYRGRPFGPKSGRMIVEARRR